MDKFRSFYIKQKEKLFSYLMRLTGDYYLSADIMQESFTRYFERYGEEGRAGLLYTIARHAVIDSLRRKDNQAQPVDENDLIDGDQQKRYLVREEYRRVMSAMQQLDHDERDILSLVVSSGLSYREIASISDISEANVKIKIHRARLKLKKILKEDAE